MYSLLHAAKLAATYLSSYSIVVNKVELGRCNLTQVNHDTMHAREKGVRPFCTRNIELVYYEQFGGRNP